MSPFRQQATTTHDRHAARYGRSALEARSSGCPLRRRRRGRLARTDDGYRLRLRSQVVEPGHNRRRLLQLTGLRAQENQARRLLNDLEVFRAELEGKGEPPISDAALAGRWLNEVFEPSIAAIPTELWGKREPAELYHERLEHRWYQSQRKGRDVGRDEALRSYVDFLRSVPDERRAVLGEP